MANSTLQLPVLFDHDGGVDDFLSLLLLLTMPQVELLGVSITPADCYPEAALETTSKLLHLLGQPQVPVSVGQYYGINAFPSAWRAQPRMLNAFPGLLALPPLAEGRADLRPSPEVLCAQLSAASQPVTVLLTGPCSTLVQALALEPRLASRIGHVVWMGGAVDVPGNVRTYNQNGTAEWNVFWDPLAAQQLLTYELPLTLIPLDVTNQVPVNMAFLRQLAAQAGQPLSHLAGQFWATTVATIPTYEYTYFMWDVLATSYLAIPEAFEVETLELAVVATGAQAGRTLRQPGSGHWVQVAKHVDTAAFYTYLLQQFGPVGSQVMASLPSAAS
ncbi:nucleoside hydrolase [Hymenobacter sp. HMF4947]|uniref:Nucleoside hydrolase n=1 Tax=Hymenobacter ginkgonis TaxID=2682976 RepID=A0A7K1T8H1_9BACT|nr:nucleoside hydrolase [Hymenobacter ginkgonis]MVN74704.1 nucleoside hydrolase [Hymenobacter ginkgonis]